MSSSKIEPLHPLKNPYLSAARHGENNFWSYLGTISLVVAAAISATMIVGLITIALTGETDVFNLSPIPFLIVNMAAFPAAIFALWLGIRLLHKRSFKSIWSPLHAFSWRFLVISAGLWFLLGAVADGSLALLVNPGNYVWQFETSRFFPYAIVTLLLVPIQATAEELVFRGYLFQGLGNLTKRPWIAMLLSSSIFAALHLSNPEVAEYGLPIMAVYYLTMGLFLCIVTLRTNSLETAAGLHIANNLYALLIVTFPGSTLPSPALFRMRNYDSLLGLAAFLVMTLLYYILSDRMWRKERLQPPVKQYPQE